MFCTKNFQKVLKQIEKYNNIFALILFKAFIFTPCGTTQSLVEKDSDAINSLRVLKTNCN